jgi:hypothetical protein
LSWAAFADVFLHFDACLMTRGGKPRAKGSSTNAWCVAVQPEAVSNLHYKVSAKVPGRKVLLGRVQGEETAQE